MRRRPHAVGGAELTATQGPAVHHGPMRSRVSSPNGLTPGPAARAWARWTCRHLTRVGIPPAETPAISARARSPRAGPGTPRGPAGTARPAPGRRRGGRSSPASARPTPACSPPPPPAGRSGSTASGTGCRRQAGRGLAPRRAGRTGSGAPPPGRRAAGGRAAPPPPPDPPVSRLGWHGPRAVHWLSSSAAGCPPPGRSTTPARTTAGGAARAGAGGRSATRLVVQHDVGVLPRAHELQPLPGLGDHVLVVVPLGHRARQLRMRWRWASWAATRLVDLGLLGQVDPHRVGVGQRQREQHHDRAPRRGRRCGRGRGARVRWAGAAPAGTPAPTGGSSRPEPGPAGAGPGAAVARRAGPGRAARWPAPAPGRARRCAPDPAHWASVAGAPGRPQRSSRAYGTGGRRPAPA